MGKRSKSPPLEDPRRWLPMRAAIEAPQQPAGTIELANPALEQAMVTGKLRHMRRALSKKYKLTRNGKRCVMNNAFQPIRGLTMFQLSSPGKLLIADGFRGCFFRNSGEREHHRNHPQDLRGVNQNLVTIPTTATIVGLLAPNWPARPHPRRSALRMQPVLRSPATRTKKPRC